MIYWPLYAFIIGLFGSGVALAVGLTVWILGSLREQDAKRIEMKEAVLYEIRRVFEKISERFDHLENELQDLATRVTRLEVHMGIHQITHRPVRKLGLSTSDDNQSS